jgi:hypothetical protein
MPRSVVLAAAVIALTSAVGCRPSDVLQVPPPAGVVAGGALNSQAGAEAAYTVARFQLFGGMVGPYGQGVLAWSELLSDELTYAGYSFYAIQANVDGRSTRGDANFQESGDTPWQTLLQGRSAVLLAIPGLMQYEPAAGRSKVGEAYALAGYAELLLAEDYCAGTPLDRVIPGGGIDYEMSLSTDSLLGVAVAHFDSALAQANGDASVQGLASVGLGRALLDRGQGTAAANAVQGVAASFVYSAELGHDQITNPYIANLYASSYSSPYAYELFFNTADGEGGNGLNFLSAHDPRLTFDSSLMTASGTPWYLPAKFEVNFSLFPIATGVEAALISAEVALATNAVTWLNDLNALRTDGTFTVPTVGDTVYGAGTGGVAGLAPLADPGSDSGRVSLMFRERAFWLFGTGSRLGDLRRLVRQYQRSAEQVFPTGPYPNGSNLAPPIINYGTDVSLTLPTPAGGLTITNPNYKGCTTPTSSA